jgi:hypothetical protein
MQVSLYVPIVYSVIITTLKLIAEVLNNSLQVKASLILRQEATKTLSQPPIYGSTSWNLFMTWNCIWVYL